MNRSNRNRLVVAVGLVMLAGCGESTSPQAIETPPEPPRETPIADGLKAPIDRARAVEDLALTRKAQMDDRLAELEGETPKDE